MRAMAGQGDKPAEPVDFRELKALLPAELPGFARESATGERSGTMGMSVATAEALYRKEGGGAVRIKFSDLGGLGGMGAMTRAGWAMAELDRETETGYERTTVIKGRKAMQRYDRASNGGEVEVLVDGRIMVEVSGDGVSEEEIAAALDRVELDKLEAIKPKPAE